MLHELHKKRRLISLHILPFLIGSWLTLVCQGCFAMDMDSLDGHAFNIVVEQSDLIYPSHCSSGTGSKAQDYVQESNGGLSSPDERSSASVQCQQLMLAEDLVTDAASLLVESTDYSSPVLLYSYTDPEIHFPSSSYTIENVHARSDLYIPEKTRILLI